MGWLHVVQGWAREHDVRSECLQQIRAFGWPGEEQEIAGAEPFSVLEKRSHQDGEHLIFTVSHRLVPEVNVSQAQLFGRRVDGVRQLLHGLAEESDTGRVLLVAFVQRILQVLDVRNPPMDKPPRALRVRAVTDYFYSLGAVNVHRSRRVRKGVQAVSLEHMVTQTQWRHVDDGFTWTTLEGDVENGPFRATVACIDPSRFTMEAVDLREACARRESFETTVQKSNAVLGVSGGFFLYSEPDIAPPSRRFDPVDCLIQNGTVVNPPCFGRPSLIQRRSGAMDIQILQPLGMQVCGREFSCRVDGKEWTVWTRAQGEVVPRGGLHIGIVGGMIVSIERDHVSSIPLNGWILVGPKGSECSWRIGESVSYQMEPSSDPIWSAMGGGPHLTGRTSPRLADSGFCGTAPPRTFSADETGDCNLLPRMAVGLRRDQSVVFAAVDGRQFERALGVTLGHLGGLMHVLGCVVAMNLDGGASKRMIVEGKVQDLSASDVVVGAGEITHVRPVRTALLWRRRHS